MSIPVDPNVVPVTRVVITAFQVAGTLLIALLLRLLTPTAPGRFVRHWSRAWVALAAALVCLNVSLLAGPLLPADAADRLRRPALAAYCLFEYAFGFSLWVGCRTYARGTDLSRADWRLFAPAAAFGLAAPALVPSVDLLFPFHAVIFGGFCLLAGLTLIDCPAEGRRAGAGRRLLRVALFGQTALFWHYGLVMAWRMTADPHPDLFYLHYSALYDALVKTLLAFGMVVLTTEQVRRELEQKNRDLAVVSEQLAVAARTDPLTGLLNRRAYNAMLTERAGGPFAGSVAVIDLNHLKRMNDASGHQAGDDAIRLVARALRSHFRITDPVFRTGGDEFVAVLEGGRAAELAGRMEAVDRSLTGCRLSGVAGPQDVVIAWGMADFDSAAELPAALHRADLAMYECKARRKGSWPGAAVG